MDAARRVVREARGMFRSAGWAAALGLVVRGGRGAVTRENNAKKMWKDLEPSIEGGQISITIKP